MYVIRLSTNGVVSPERTMKLKAVFMCKRQKYTATPHEATWHPTQTAESQVPLLLLWWGVVAQLCAVAEEGIFDRGAGNGGHKIVNNLSVQSVEKKFWDPFFQL